MTYRGYVCVCIYVYDNEYMYVCLWNGWLVG